MRERGFTILEVVIAVSVAAVGALLVTEALSGAQGAASADYAKSRAVRTGDQLLRRLGIELTQSSVGVDTDLPPGEEQRLWILANGVRFQKVVGYDMDPDGTVTQRWSPLITYAWDQPAGEVRRAIQGGKATVAARGVTAFAVQKSAAGQVVVMLETRAGAVNRGTDSLHRRTIHITPRNALK